MHSLALLTLIATVNGRALTLTQTPGTKPLPTSSLSGPSFTASPSTASPPLQTPGGKPPGTYTKSVTAHTFTLGLPTAKPPSPSLVTISVPAPPGPSTWLSLPGLGTDTASAPTAVPLVRRAPNIDQCGVEGNGDFICDRSIPTAVSSVLERAPKVD